MMEALKIARRYSGAFNPDDYLDGAGYAGVAYEIKAMQMQDAADRLDRAIVAAGAARAALPDDDGA
jgi:hypothetical protein